MIPIFNEIILGWFLENNNIFEISLASLKHKKISLLSFGPKIRTGNKFIKNLNLYGYEEPNVKLNIV